MSSEKFGRRRLRGGTRVRRGLAGLSVGAMVAAMLTAGMGVAAADEGAKTWSGGGDVCDVISSGPVSSNLNGAGWNFSETRTTGHNDYVSGGIKVWTEGATSTDKAAGYVTVNNLPLADVGEPSISFAYSIGTGATGGRPSIQLVVDLDADGESDGILVGEPWAYPTTGWWASPSLSTALELDPAYQYKTLPDYISLIASDHADAKIVAIGYSLGSGVKGESVITSIVAGCVRYTFNYAKPGGTNPGDGAGVINPPAPEEPEIEVLGESCEENIFPDVSGNNPFCGAIAWMKDQGITLGSDDGRFHPLNSVTRQAMAGFLYRMKNGATAPACATSPFDDVTVDNPFCGAIAWMKSQGITVGSDDGGFHPAEEMTRGAMAAFLYRLQTGEATAPACTTKPFADVAVDNPFCGAIAWMKSEKISVGSNDGGFHPADSVTRQVMAGFLFRMNV